ncbi:TadE family protein [Streptomyces sp. NP160]|uniref:TadE family protein n=1 Tax=Streptomyces sp. NP160 TaxID=2586637 RepID=UPI00214BDDDF|nr:TadE family protein [Streptomyces sp. NP160]
MVSGDERGSTSLELVVVFPAVLLIIFGLVQGALWYHARDVARAAAAGGAAAARAEGSSADDGRLEATSFLSANGDAVLNAQVDARRDATRVEVVVIGHSVSLLPGVPGPAVRESVTGPVERFTSRSAP